MGLCKILATVSRYSALGPYLSQMRLKIFDFSNAVNSVICNRNKVHLIQLSIHLRICYLKNSIGFMCFEIWICSSSTMFAKPKRHLDSLNEISQLENGKV